MHDAKEEISSVNIAMIVGSYRGLSGVCTHVQELCRFLGREGINMVVLDPDMEKLNSKELQECRS